MKKFLCTFYLPVQLDQDFWELIPRHRNYINNLMREEVIITYSVNNTRTKGWVVVNAESEAEAASGKSAVSLGNNKRFRTNFIVSGLGVASLYMVIIFFRSVVSMVYFFNWLQS